MRLLSITVKNYRIHREITVSLHPSRNLIGGPNECGKSTLAEAAHRALFLKARITGTARDGMTSTLHPGAPEVEVCFQKHGCEYHLTKRFSGSTGSCLLRETTGGGSWQGDEAEERLAALLGVDAAVGGRNAADKSSRQWAHLWVWQGEAGQDPAEHASAQKDALLARLQTGEAAAILSTRDAASVKYFKAQYEELFTKAGAPRKDTEQGRAQTDFENAGAALANARTAHERLRQAAQDWETANAQAARATASLTELKQQHLKTGKLLEEVSGLRHLLERQTPAEQTAKQEWEDLRAVNEQIVNLQAETAKRQHTLEAMQLEVRRLEAETEERRKRNGAAEAAWSAAQAAARGARLHQHLAASRVAFFENRERRSILLAKQETVSKQREELKHLTAAQAALPDIDAARLAELRKLEVAVSNAEAELQGMAAGLEIVRADAPVRINGEELRAGETRLLQEETMVGIGAGIELRIRPGGGAGLAKARQRTRETRAALQKALDAAGAGTVAEAEAIQWRRSQNAAGLEKVRAVLAGMGADRLEQELADAETSLRAAEAETARRLAALESAGFSMVPAPVDPASARCLAEETVLTLQQAENQETETAVIRAAAAAELQLAAEKLAGKTGDLQTYNEKVSEDAARLRVLTEMHGDEPARAARLAQLWQILTEAGASRQQTQNALQVLQPEHLAADRDRLARALECTEQERQEAEKNRAAARGLLISDGSGDPRETLALAEAAVCSAKERLEQARRQAEAVRLLHGLFQEEQRALAERFTRPLAEKIDGYLQCIFGPGARAEVALQEGGGFAELRFIRSGGAAFPFSVLSGGAREQVAAAMRLAMAQVLAEDHGGCLPVVFDDAFVCADPERVQALQRMLDLAAARGLQVIVLTCNPGDYAGLGAEVMMIRSE